MVTQPARRAPIIVHDAGVFLTINPAIFYVR